MQLVVALLAVTVVSFALELPASHHEFRLFMRIYNKKYSSPEEQKRRFSCFKQNLNNAYMYGDDRWGITEFTDRCRGDGITYPESQPEERNPYSVPIDVNAPSSWDWRTKGVIAPVANQGMCGGGCVAYSAVENAEAHWAIANNNKLTILSAEELLQCPTGNFGCNGGYFPPALEFCVKHGVCSESYYPYTSSSGTTGTCNQTKVGHPVAHFKKYVNLTRDEIELASFCATNGPFAAAVDGMPLTMYTGGIITKACTSRQLDHTVAVIGYGEETGTKYWICKNSWGVSWGEKGYFRIERGVNCLGMTEEATSLLP